METILRAFSRLWWFFENREQKQRWVRVIYRDGEPLITRYYLFSTRFIEDAEFFKEHPRLQRFLKPLSQRLVVHNAHQSDSDGLHDHPWPWASWILSGGYGEHTPEGYFWRWPGHLRFRPAKAFHRLILDPNTRKEVFSLFWMGPRQQEWGFLVGTDKSTWVPWHQHDNARDPTMKDAP